MLPLLLALVAAGSLIAALGHNPFDFYLDIYRGGIELAAWQDSLMRAATLTPIALGLIVVFRANIWNLGYQGQFLLSAAMVAGLGPHLERHLSATLTLIVLFFVAGITGAVWTLDPGDPQGLVPDQRDHHDADDDVHRHQPGRHPRQGAVPGLLVQRAADDRAAAGRHAAHASRARARTSAS